MNTVQIAVGVGAAAVIDRLATPAVRRPSCIRLDVALRPRIVMVTSIAVAVAIDRPLHTVRPAPYIDASASRTDIDR